MAKKICIVVQRYGLEVNGGAELEARLLAEHLLPYFSGVDVFTTKAIDNLSWENEYEQDVETINGVVVHRFAVDKARDLGEFNKINERFIKVGLDELQEREWLEKQGPYAPALVQAIKDHLDEYDAFVFFTYLYYPTVLGLAETVGKSLLVPTAHDERYLYMQMYEEVFASPSAILFNTDEERDFIHATFGNSHIPYEIGAAGVDVPEEVDPERFKAKYGLDDFIVYVGRIEAGKNCGELFHYFDQYKARHSSDLKLVLMGKPAMPIPERDDIVSLGFVDEQDKFEGIKAAKALVLPSELESLSFVVLEAMLVETAVMVNGKCEVLKQHCLKSNGAFYYTNYLEFEAELDYILGNPDKVEVMLANAKEYADANYQWNRVTNRVSALIDRIGMSGDQ